MVEIRCYIECMNNERDCFKVVAEHNGEIIAHHWSSSLHFARHDIGYKLIDNIDNSFLCL